MATVAVDFREGLAWAAGFFDGEGHVHYGVRRTARGTAQRTIGVTVAQSGRERLDHLAEVLGAGRVAGPYQAKDERSQPYPQWADSRLAQGADAEPAMSPGPGPERRRKL